MLEGQDRQIHKYRLFDFAQHNRAIRLGSDQPNKKIQTDTMARAEVDDRLGHMRTSNRFSQAIGSLMDERCNQRLSGRYGRFSGRAQREEAAMMTVR